MTTFEGVGVPPMGGDFHSLGHRGIQASLSKDWLQSSILGRTGGSLHCPSPLLSCRPWTLRS